MKNKNQQSIRIMVPTGFFYPHPPSEKNHIYYLQDNHHVLSNFTQADLNITTLIKWLVGGY